MYANKPQNSLKSAPSPIIAVVAIIVVIAFIGVLAYKFVLPQQPAVNTTPTSATDIWVFDKAKETHGDISKLSAEDRDKLQQMTHGMGGMALEGAWKKSQ